MTTDNQSKRWRSSWRTTGQRQRKRFRRLLFAEHLEPRVLLSLTGAWDGLETAPHGLVGELSPSHEAPLAADEPVNRTLGGTRTVWLEAAASEVQSGFFSGQSALQLLASSEDGIRARLSVPGVLLTDVRAAGMEFTRLNVPGWGSAGQTGQAELPSFRTAFQIPDGVSVVSEYEVLATAEVGSGLTVFPRQPAEPDGGGDEGPNATPDFKYDPAYYGQAAASDWGHAVLVSEPQIARGTSVVLLEIQPFRFSPATGVVEAITELSLRIGFRPTGDGGAGDDGLADGGPADGGEGDDGGDGGTGGEDGGGLEDGGEPAPLAGVDYLVITTEQFREEVQPLVDWKARKGFQTQVVALANAGATTADVARWIDHAYHQDDPVSYVLLVGDYDDVPSNQLDGFISDQPYAYVDGADSLPDLTIGRLPVGTESEVTTVVNKILAYERTPDLGDWYDDVLAAGEFQDSDDLNGIADRWFMETTMHVHDYLRDEQGLTMHTALAADTAGGPPYYYRASSFPHRISVSGSPPYSVPADVVALWTSDAQATANVTAAINAGVGLVQHRDHGSPTGWGDPPYSVSQVNALANGVKTPVVFSTNCSTGTFNYAGGDSFAEAFLKHPNGGAVGILAATEVSYSGYNDLLVHGMYTAFWPDYDATHAGNPYPYSMRPAEAMNFGKYYMFSYEGWNAITEIEFNEFHWFGDPEMMLRTATPEVLTVVHPATLETHLAQQVMVQVSRAGVPEAGARVAITRLGTGESWVGTTDGAGKVSFDGVAPSALGAYDIVVTGFNAIPYEGTITSSSSRPVPTLVVPADGSATNLEGIRWLDVAWAVAAPGALNPATIGATDLQVTGLTFQSPVQQSATVWRYPFTGSLTPGLVGVTFPAAAVTTVAGAGNLAWTATFVYDAAGPAGSLVQPAGGSEIHVDPGFVDVLWSDGGAAGLDVGTLDAGDITVSGVTVRGVPEYLGGGVYRYAYDGTLSVGTVHVSFVGGEVADNAGNPSAAGAATFAYAPLTITSAPLLPPAGLVAPYQFTLAATGGVPPYAWFVSEPAGSIVISEVFPGTPDAVEFTNVSGRDIDLSGWQVLLFDSGHTTAPLTALTVPDGVFCPAGSVFTVNEYGTAPGTYPSFRTGVNIDWVASSTTGVLLLDRGGAVMDFMAAAALVPSAVTDPVAVVPEHWQGAQVAAVSSDSNAYARTGGADTNQAADWAQRAPTMGALNSGLSVPFSGLDAPLPAGLQLAGATGVLSGTPAEAGVFDFVVSVRDTDAPVQRRWQSFRLTVSDAPLLIVELPATAGEGDGVLSGVGTVWRTAPVTEALVVELNSNDLTEVTVPATVTIPAGAGSATFDVTIVDDLEVDGPEVATITATASGWTAGSAQITVADNDTAVPEGFLVATAAGLVSLDASGAYGVILPTAGHYEGVEIRGDDYAAYTAGAIVRYDRNRVEVARTRVPSGLDFHKFIALADGRFALPNNVNDEVYFLAADGTLLATAKLRPVADGLLQNLDGLQVGNRLIVTEDGSKRVMAIDLATYDVAVFKDLATATAASWLGSIAYDGGTFYVTDGLLQILAFTESGPVRVAAQLPAGALSGITVDGGFAYVSALQAGKVYRVDLATGASSEFATGLASPRDIEHLGPRVYAEIAGAKFHDEDGDSSWDVGEPGLAGWQIYLDQNRNGRQDTGEPVAVTEADGEYRFRGLTPGLYHVAEVQQAGWLQTAPRRQDLLFDVDFDDEALGPIPTQPSTNPPPLTRVTGKIIDTFSSGQVVATAGDLTDQPILLSGIAAQGQRGLASVSLQPAAELTVGIATLQWKSAVTALPPDDGSFTGVNVIDIVGNSLNDCLGISYTHTGKFKIEDGGGEFVTGSYEVGRADRFRVDLDLDAGTYELYVNGVELRAGTLDLEGDFYLFTLRSRSFVGAAAPLAIDDIQIEWSPTRMIPGSHAVVVQEGQTKAGVDFGNRELETVELAFAATAMSRFDGDADGDQDLVLTLSGGGIAFQEFQGGYPWAAEVFAAGTEYESVQGYHAAGGVPLIVAGGDGGIDLYERGPMQWDLVEHVDIGYAAARVVPVDADLDGDMDLVVGAEGSFPNGSGVALMLLRNNAGTFAAEIVQGDFHGQVGFSNTVGDLAVADVSGDGYPDLFLSARNTAGHSYITWEMLYGGTSGYTGSKFDGLAFRKLELGDLDGDGSADLAATGPNTVYVAWGDGSGIPLAFAGVYSFPDSYDFVYGLDLVDWNRDGRLDIAGGGVTQDVVVLANRGSRAFKTEVLGSLSAEVRHVEAVGDEPESWLAAATLQGLTVWTTGRAVNVGEIRGAKWFDRDGDGSWEAGEPGLAGWEIYLDTNDNGRFDQGEPATVTGSNGRYAFSGVSPGSYLVGEVPQAGWHQTFPILGGGLWFDSAKTAAAGANPLEVAASDVDHDGDLDLAVSNYHGLVNTATVLRNDGSGTFVADAAYATGTNPAGIVAVDLNGDSFDDLVTANFNSANISVLFNNGAGLFVPGPSYATGSHSWRVDAADLDGDGDQDLAIVSYSGGALTIYLNDGSGALVRHADYYPTSAPYALALAEVDGDGDVDAAVGQYDGKVTIYLNSGTASFASSGPFNAYARVGAMRAGDLDGDGDQDLVAANDFDDAVTVLRNNGAGAFSTSNTYGPVSDPRGLALGDFDADGDLDLAVAVRYGQTVVIYENDGSGTFHHGLDMAVAGTDLGGLVAADLNQDGRPDLAVAEFSPGTVSVLLNTSSGTKSHRVLVAAGAVAAHVDFGNHTVPGQIRGAKWHDWNGNGVWDQPAEPGLPGWTIFLDQNQNGVRDAGEPSTVTDQAGNYAFADLATGTYFVAEERQSGWAPTSPRERLFTTDGYGIRESDPLTGTETRWMDAPGSYYDARLALGPGTLYYAAYDSAAQGVRLYELDPNSGAQRAAYTIAGVNYLYGLAYLHGQIHLGGYSSSAGSYQLVTWDPSQQAVVKTAAVPFYFSGLAGAADRGLLIAASGSQLLWLDPQTAAIVGQLSVPAELTASGFSTSWVEYSAGTLVLFGYESRSSTSYKAYRLDPVSGAILGTLNMSSSTRDCAGDGTAGVWPVAVDAGQVVANIDFGNAQVSSAPLTPDLLAASDSGLSDADGITGLDNSTSAKALQFQVAGTLPGATVTLYARGRAIGSAVATGATTLVTTDGVTPLTDHRWYIEARQQEPGKLVSRTQAALPIWTDTLAPLMPGIADGAFGTRGQAATTVGSSSAYAWDVAIQADQRVVAAGYAYVGNYPDFAIARWNADGTLDAGFGTGGIVTVPVGTSYDYGRAVAVQADQKILVGGYMRSSSSDYDFAVVRLRSDGTLDSSFGSGGIVTTSLPGGSGYGYTLALQADGKILLGGGAYNGSNYDFAVARYLPDGTLDTGFGTGGIATTAAGTSSDYIYDLALQPDGKIVAAGYAYSGSTDFAVVRYLSDGALDSSFGSGGIVRTPVGTSTDQAYAVAVQADGKLVVAGVAYVGSGYDFALVRYQANGTLDTSFDGDGKVTTALSRGQDYAYGMALLPDGRIAVAGTSDNGYDTDFALAIYRPDGRLDTEYPGGAVLSGFDVGNDTGRAVAVQADGNIVVGGYDGQYRFAVTRYHAHPQPEADLQAGSDTGYSNSDNVTAATTLTFDVPTAAPYFRFHRDGNPISGPYELPATYVAAAQSVGIWDYAVAAVDAAGNASALSIPLTVTIESGSAAEIRGLKWEDADGDGVQDAGEGGLGNWTIFLDANRNGQLDTGVVSVTASGDVNLAIPDVSTVTSPLTVVGNGLRIDDVNVTLTITHTYDSDLAVFLISPQGTRVELFTYVGGSGDNFVSTTLDDEATTSIAAGAAPFTGGFVPEGALSALDGESASGTWQLEVTDDANADVGTLVRWSLTLTATERWTVTSSEAGRVGHYAFSGLVPGTYVVGEVLQNGWRQIFPGAAGASDGADADGADGEDGWGGGPAELGEGAGQTPVVDTAWITGSGPSALNNLDLDAVPPDDPATDDPTTGDPDQEGSGVFDVYVEPGLLAGIQAALSVYAADLSAEGYQVTIQEFSGDAAALRVQLRSRWLNHALEGALLVGDLPYVMFTTEDNWDATPVQVTYPHDLYFMDLDGTYVLNATGVDEHLDGAGDVGPEIYVSRITTGNLALTGASEIALINDYLAKVHAYRIGVLHYSNRGLVFADDDWSYWGEEQMDDLYSTVLAMNDASETTRSGYLGALALDYESILEALHSWPQGHSLRVGEGSEPVFNSDVLQVNPRAGFYNMFNCSGARFTEPDHLIGTYVYGGDYGLNAVGSTKTGSMLNFQDYYQPQGSGESVGQAFADWFADHAVPTGVSNLDWKVDWFYGMTMQGDPTLRPASMGDGLSGRHAVEVTAGEIAEHVDFGNQRIDAPPAVSRVWPGLEGGALSAGTTAVSIEFSEAVVGGGLAANYQLQSLGADALLGTADDVVRSLSVSYAGNTATLSFPALVAGVYRLTVRETLADYAGQALDGNQDGMPGEDWVADFVVIPAGGDLLYAGPTYSPGGDNPIAVAIGDLNGDGRADLAVANSQSGTVGILLGQANGTLAAAETYSSGGNAPWSVVIGDLNGDGRADVAVANYSSNSVGVLLGRGDGTFAAAATYPSGGNVPRSVAIGDLNGDGRADLAVANADSGNVGVLLGAGDGTFAAAALYNPGGSSPRSLAIRDLNGDGREDLAVANFFSDSVGILLAQADGTLAAATVYASGGSRPNSLALGDLNGDGWTDLAVANSSASGQNVGVLLGQAGGTFAAATTYASGGATVASVAIGDVNLDGRADLAVANYASHTVAVLPGQGDGTFAAAASYASGGDNPFAVALGDLNGDEREDLAVANYYGGNVGVLPNSLALALFSPQGLLFDVQPGGFMAGQLVQGRRNAFDGLNRLQVDTLDYAPAPQPLDFQDGLRTLVVPAQTIGGLNVHREITVPATGGEDFARTVDVFENPTGAAITTTVRIVGNLGSAAATTVFATADGDTDVELTDPWIGTDDADGTGAPAVVHYVYGPGDLRPTAVRLAGERGDNIEWTYTLTVPAGATVRLAHFTVLATTRAAAVAAAGVLVGAEAFGGQAAAFLTPAEVNSLANFYNWTPTAITLSNGTIAENAAAASLVGVFSTADPDVGDTFTYTLLDPAHYPDNALFAVPAGTSELRTAAVFDYEVRAAYTICVRSTDQGGLSTEREFTVTVTDVPELPQVAVWDGRADGGGASADANWRTARNWVGDAAPRPGDELVFPSGVSVLNTANDFPAGTLFGQILVQADGYTLGGNSIRLRDGIGTSGSNTTVALPIALESAATMLSSAELALNGPLDLHGYPVTFEGSGATTVNGLLWGEGGLTKAGAGTLRLAGTASNTFGGAVAVTAGILQLRQAGAISAANPVTVTDGGTLDLYGQRPGFTNVTISGHGAGAGLGVLANTSTTSGAYDAIRNLTLAGDAWIGCTNGGPGGENGRLGFGYGSGTWINLNGHTLTKIGSNEVIWRVQTTSTGAGGQLVIDGGAVASEFLSNNLPATVVVHAGGTLSALRANQNANVTLHTGATLASYDAWDAGRTTTWTGTITLAGDATLSAGTLFGYYWQPTHMTITGPIVGVGGFTKTGSATLTLGGNNTYQGNTVIQAGRVKLDVAAPVQWIADTLSGSAVSVWYDAVSGRPAFNSTTAQQPALSVGAINGHHAVTFDGTDDNLYVSSSSSPLSNAGDFSLAVVFRPAASAGSGGNAGGQWYSYTGLVDAEQAGVTNEWGLVWSADNQVGAGLGNPDVTLWSGRTAALNSPHVAVYTRAGGTIGLYLDGQAVATGGGGAAVRNQTPFWIGSGSFPSRYFRGDIAEVRLFNQALSGAEANALTAALGGAYGVAGLSLSGQDANRLPDTTAVTIAAGATLDLNHLSERIGSLSGPSGSCLTLGAGTLTAGDALSTVFAGQISGSGGLTKTGTGSLTLSGDNTYAGGTAVQDGTLLVNNSTGSGTGTGPVTVQNPGSVLGGAGRIAGPVTVLAAATLAPGSPVTGTASLATGPLTLSGNTTFQVQLNGTGAGQWDQLAVAGAVELGGAALSVGLGGLPSDGDLFTIIANDGADPVSGTFAGLPEGAVLTAGGVNFQLSYRGGDGNDVVLSADIAANLWITAAYLTDGAGNRMDVPPVGSFVWVQVEYRSRDLPAGSSYMLSHTFQGVTLSHTVDWGAGMIGDGFWWHRWGAWLVQPGAHDVDVMLDSGETVVETSETDNAVSFTVTPMTFGPKFVTPLGGRPYQDWSIVNYVDLDLGDGVSDYRGGTYSYNGHDALDLTLANFAAMDRGVPVLAAAAGTVVAVHDGEFDRNTSCTGAANYVIVDHGQGWVTNYVHFRADTIQVSVGDQVTAGEPLGLVGSSGCSSDAQLHFSVYHNGHAVETYVAPEAYWASPLPYSGDVPGVLDAGTTNYNPPGNELKERPSETEVFDQSAGQWMFSWAVPHGIPLGHSFKYQWRRPDGSLYAEKVWNDFESHYGHWVWGFSLPSVPPAGTWRFAVVYDGSVLWEDTFQVTAAGAPEVRVDQGATFIIDGRTTPIDFGIGQAGQNGRELTFTVTNHGSDPLTTGGLQVPAGFSVVEGLAATLAPGASDTFTVRLDTGSSGVRKGQIRFSTNDADEAEFNFAVRGRVFGPPQITAIADDTGWSSTDGVTRDTTLLVSGTSDANNRIDVYRGGTWIGNTAADSSGRWSLDATGTSLAEGSHAFTATATDGAGSTSIPSAAYWVTIDRASPTASGLSPADGATGVAVDSYLVMAFNETIRPGAGSILVKKADDQSTVAAIDVAGGSVTVAGVTVTIDPGVTLTPLVEYYVEVPAGAFWDAAGNAFAGISGPATWNFTAETFRVTGLQSTVSGFDAIFNGPLDATVLNLYDGAGGALGTADVVVLNNAGQGVAGSLIVAGNRRTVTWVATGSQLPPGTYAVTLKSGAAAFRDTAGNLLDGDTDNTSNDDFTTSFTVASSAARVVSVPDMARGAGQPVNIPNTASGLPIRLDNAAGVTSLAVDLVYDQTLLTITAATLAAGLPADWGVTLATSTAGVAKVTASGTTPLSGTNVDVVRLTAAVPSNAPYGASQAIRLNNVSLNGGAIAAVGDVAVHKAVYLGDADGSGIHSSADAFLTVQAALGLASGFAAHAWTDPRIVGDADGSGVLSAADAFLIVQEGLDLSEPFVPDNPHIGLAPVGGGVDPQFRINANVPARAGGVVTVPVQLDIDPAATNVGALDFDLFFDASRLTIQVPDGISAGADTAGGWAISARLIDAGHLRVGMISSGGQPLAPGLREIARLEFRVGAGESSGTDWQSVLRCCHRSPTTDYRSPITVLSDGSETHPTLLDIEPVDSRAGGYAWTEADGSVLIRRTERGLTAASRERVWRELDAKAELLESVLTDLASDLMSASW